MKVEIKQTVLLELFSKESNITKKTVIHVVKYNDGKPKLEKRNYYLNDVGKWSMGRMIGFTLTDFALVVSKINDVLAALATDVEIKDIQCSMKKSEMKINSKCKSKKRKSLSKVA